MIKDKKTLLKNTIMLYVLRFSTYFFALITVPYQTRVLGLEIYGKLGLATALMVYFDLFLDFGFILSATEDVARNKGNNSKLSEIFTSVISIKTVFAFLSMIILVVLCYFIPQYRKDFILYFMYLLASVSNALLPDFMYRGLEDMSLITYRTVSVKALFTILIFVLLKDKSQYLFVPLLILLGNVIAIVWSYIDLNKRYSIRFYRINYDMIKYNFKKSGTFFLSRIAGTVYSTANTIILGFIDPISVGLYTAASKLISTGQSALSPIADSLYPYMIRNKDFKLVKRVLLILMPIIILGTGFIFIFADELCILFFGQEFAATGNILRCMLPMAIFTLPDYLLGFPTLSAMGLTKHANISIYVSTCIHIVNLFIIFHFGWMSASTLALLTSIALGVELTYRATVAFINRKNV